MNTYIHFALLIPVGLLLSAGLALLFIDMPDKPLLGYYRKARKMRNNLATSQIFANNFFW